MNGTETPPVWFKYSHHDRFRWANITRRKWFKRRVRGGEDISGRTVYLDGRWITDIPSFHLSLGEAVNGPGGYFGNGLAAMDDCLCGGFGIRSPLTIRLSHFEKVRAVLDGRAWCRLYAEVCRGYSPEDYDFDSLVDCGYFGDGSPEDIAKWQSIYEAALSGEPFDCSDEYNSYFDALLKILQERGAAIISADEIFEGVKEAR